MNLRTQLLLFAAGTTLLSATVSAGGLWILERRYLREEARETARHIEESVAKAARESVLAEDPVSLVGTLRFLREQWPALAYARVEWEQGGKSREVTVGERSSGNDARARAFASPRDGRMVRVEAGLDRGELDRSLREAEGRLGRQLAAVLAVLLVLGLALAAAWAYRLVRPIALLAEGAEALGQGRLGLKLEHRSGDELGRLVEQFNRMSERLAELDAMKKDFVSGVTHELRSPVAAVESMLNVLLARPADPQNREYLERARTNLQRLSSLIDNLLDAAKIERGKFDVKPEPMEVAPAVRDVLGLFEAKASERRIKLESQVAAPPVRADPGALRRVLVNLVSNALKFTPDGGRVLVRARPTAAGAVELSVSDNGRGMAPDETTRLFEKFARGRSAARTPGTGLGLYLVRQAVEAHGGRVAVDSAPGRGTTFTTLWPKA